MFVPAAGAQMIIALPGEQLRAVVKRVVSRDMVLVEIGQPMRPTHHYRAGDIVACRRQAGELGEYWQAVDDRLMFQSSRDWDDQNRKKPAAKPAKPGKPRKNPAKPEKLTVRQDAP